VTVKCRLSAVECSWADGRLRNSYPASYIPQRTADISQSLFEEGTTFNIARIRCKPGFAGASAGWPDEKFLSG